MKCNLSQNEPVKLEGGNYGLVLHCTSGTVWLTCGDGRDYLIKAGGSFTLPPQSFAIIEAVDCAVQKRNISIRGDEKTLCCVSIADGYSMQQLSGSDFLSALT